MNRTPTRRVMLIGLVLLAWGGFGAASRAAADTVLHSKDGRLELTVPAQWAERDGLNPSAQIGATNADDHLYVAVISEPKADFDGGVEHYGKMITAAMARKLKGAQLSNPVSLKINGNPAVRYELTGSFNGIRIGYVVTVVETATRFNQILGWTARSQFDKSKGDLGKLAGGLKEVPAQ